MEQSVATENAGSAKWPRSRVHCVLGAESKRLHSSISWSSVMCPCRMEQFLRKPSFMLSMWLNDWLFASKTLDTVK